MGCTLKNSFRSEHLPTKEGEIVPISKNANNKCTADYIGGAFIISTRIFVVHEQIYLNIRCFDYVNRVESCDKILLNNLPQKKDWQECYLRLPDRRLLANRQDFEKLGL